MNDWKRIQAAIRGSVSEENFGNWIEPVRIGELTDRQILHLIAPTAEAQHWLESEFQTEIRSIAWKLGLDFRSVVIDVAEDTDGAANAPLQQSFDFSPEPPRLNDRYTFDRFVVGSCNELAHAAAKSIAQDPSHGMNPLYMHSDVGMGKTHLLQAIGNDVSRRQPSLRVIYVTAEEFMNEMIKSIRFNSMPRFHERFRKADLLLVDDIQIIGSKEGTQEEFFHTFNALHTDGRRIVMSSDTGPEHIRGLVNRLESRFSSGFMVDIKPPDLETKMAILDRKSAECGIELSEEVRMFIAQRLRSNIRALEAALNQLIARARFINSRISLNMARTLLSNLPQPRDSSTEIKQIQELVATEYEVTIQQIMGRHNSPNMSNPRHVAMYMSRTVAKVNLTGVAKAFDRHHTTVRHAVQKIEAQIETDRELSAKIEDLTARLKAS